ncbi:MAG: serine/threonine-protein kinase, partial [Kofleriaceae bacterium]
MRGRVPEVDRTVVERRDPLIGTRFDDRFRIDARLAAGGFGAIYRATDLHAQHEVALKILHPSLTTDPAIIARFRREGATLITLRDPHTVSAYELGEAPDGTLYIAMELLRGQTLHEVYTRHSGPLPWRRVAAIARAVCSSLAEAHDRGIIHRDLKPANIHLQQRSGNADFVKVLDFGIAKILRGSDLEASDLTQGGQMVGTFDYMAPEQMLGGEIGGRTDIYSLGVVMYEMVGGRLPYGNANSPTHLLAMLLTSVPARLTDRVPVPPALDDIVLRCLAREPHDRFADVGELSNALGEVIARGGFHEDATVTSHVFPDLPGGPSTDPGGPATELTGGPATEPGADDVTVLVRSDIRDALPEDTPLPQAAPVVRRPPRPGSVPGSRPDYLIPAMARAGWDRGAHHLDLTLIGQAA